MSATFEQARDEMLAVFKAAWDTTGHYAAYPDRPEEKPKGADPWARVTVRHAVGEQGSLANHEGRRRWERRGTLFVQIFTPSGEGLSRSDTLAKIVVDALEGKSTPRGVWFRNTRINEVGPDGDWYQVNVLADFIYDEVK